MTGQVSQEVVDATLDETVRVTRRLEIYEADGETLWMGSDETPRMIDGNVSVDYGRDERRGIDLSLDNGDGVLRHDPDGFWYDKVLKAYRGIEYRNTRKIPSVAVMKDDTTFGRQSVVGLLREMGYVDITDLSAVTVTADALASYDIIVANSGVYSISAATSALLKQVYANGTANVFTIGNDNGVGQLPFVTATIQKTGSDIWQINKVAGDTPVSHGWTSYVNGSTDTGTVITGIASTARAAAYWTYGATTTYSAVYEQNQNGARWFHYQPDMTVGPFKTPMRRLFAQALGWLHNFSDLKTFESQIGEFCIDRISEGHFPHTLKVTGRDYTKRLLTDKFENSVTFRAGTSVDDLVRAIAANGRVFKTLLNSEGSYLATDVSFERGTERWKAIDDICTANGVEAYFNPQGYLTSRPFIDPTTAPTALILSTGRPDGNLVSYTKSSSDAQVYNIVHVFSENQNDLGDGIAYKAVAENNDPSSPTRVERLGRRVYPYTSAFLPDQDAANRLSVQLLKIHALEEFELAFSSVAYPWLDVGVVAGFRDPKPGVGEPDRFLLTNLTIPLSLGPMTGAGKRITIIGDVPRIEALT